MSQYCLWDTVCEKINFSLICEGVGNDLFNYLEHYFSNLYCFLIELATIRVSF